MTPEHIDQLIQCIRPNGEKHAAVPPELLSRVYHEAVSLQLRHRTGLFTVDEKGVATFSKNPLEQSEANLPDVLERLGLSRAQLQRLTGYDIRYLGDRIQGYSQRVTSAVAWVFANVEARFVPERDGVPAHIQSEYWEDDLLVGLERALNALYPPSQEEQALEAIRKERELIVGRSDFYRAIAALAYLNGDRRRPFSTKTIHKVRFMLEALVESLDFIDVRASYQLENDYKAFKAATKAQLQALGDGNAAKASEELDTATARLEDMLTRCLGTEVKLTSGLFRDR